MSGGRGIAQMIATQGPLGALTAAIDATSPLGPVESWPPALVSTVRMMLSARAEIVLFWGPDLCALYNEAYAPTIGDKHPRALGRPAREGWAELWDDLHPLLLRVMEHGETVHARDRPFYIERDGGPDGSRRGAAVDAGARSFSGRGPERRLAGGQPGLDQHIGLERGGTGRQHVRMDGASRRYRPHPAPDRDAGAGTGDIAVREPLAALDAASPPVDLLFTDVVLPGGMTGADISHAAKARQPELKVLFATGYARNAIIHHGRLDPGVQLLTKPFTYKELAVKVRDMLDRVEARQAG